MLNFINKNGSLISSLCLAASLFGGNVLGAIAQSSEQFQSNLLSQNKNDSKIVELGRLSTGEHVLEVPKEYLLQSAFKDALQRPLYIYPKLDYSRDGQPIINNRNMPRLFLWDGNKLTFVGYGISSINEFQIGNETYWASLCSDYTLCYELFVSKRNLESLKAAKGIEALEYLHNIRKDITQEGFFYVEAHKGNGRFTETITYLVNLTLTVTNSNQSVVVCEVSKYTDLGQNRRSPTIHNPNCQTGRQVASQSSAISAVSASSTSVKPTDTIAKYPTNEDFNAFEVKLQVNSESLVKLRGNQAEQRRKFQNDWKARNPNAAKFLGAWYTGNRYFYVFPSTVKGGTCVVTQDANGKLNMQIGTVLNQELRYGGGKGFFWRDRPNIIASRDSGSGNLYPIYATSGMLELPESMIGDMERQKCITTLPS